MESFSLAEPPLATLVMLNLNAAQMTCEALDAVLSQTIADRLKIVVVDNGSSDGSADIIAARFGDRVTVLRADTNLGFAGGNNLGFRHAEGKYLLLLNNDAIPEPRWAEELLKVAEAERNIVMCTSKIILHRDRRLIDCVGHNIFPDGLSRSRGNWQIDAGQYEKREESLLASGCAALYRRKEVLDCGGFDEDFFAYQDDVELGLKLRLGGGKCLYVPSAIVYHYGSATAGSYSYSKIFLIERNRVWILFIFFPWYWILLSPWYTFCRLFLSCRAAQRNQGRAGELGKRMSLFRLGRTILHAWFAALAGLPRVLRKRQQLMAAKKITSLEFTSLLRQFRAPLVEMSFGSARDVSQPPEA